MDFFHQKIKYMTGSAAFKLGHSHIGTSSYHLHWHNCVEIVYGFENSYQVHAGKQTFHLHNNDILFIPGRVMHDFNMVNQQSCLYFIQFKLSAVISEYSSSILNPTNDIILIQKNSFPQLHKEIASHIEYIIEEFDKKYAGYESMIFSNLYNIHALVERNYPIISHLPIYKESDYYLDFLTKILQYISDNYQKDISIDSVAKEFGFNNKYFGRLFHKYIGTYFNDYINELRIRKIMEKLTPDTKDITSLAYNHGFKSSSTFYRAFNKINNCSPREYISRFSL